VFAFTILIGMMLYYGIQPTAAIILLPLFMLLALMTALGVGLWLSALNVEYRDVRYIIPFLVNFWQVATPVAYPSSLLSEPWRTLYGLNPMVGVVEAFRWALLGTQPPGPMLAVSAGIVLLLLISGTVYFKRMEKTFADVV
jgi:lipopolysaccharide transport system permease protein